MMATTNARPLQPMKIASRSFSATRIPLLLVLLGFSASAHAAAPIPLRAGPVTMIFEPDNAFLRYVKVGSHEILRGITAPVRNQFWGTVLPAISQVE